jgi:2-polyprenyl-6-methoxyphenol hydroxylase-like FAD-dependent oxidoreductase
VTQVVIEGAGPAGTTLVYLLVQRGIAVTLVEASHNFGRLFRGEGLIPSGLEAARYPRFDFVHGTTVQDLLWQDDRVSGANGHLIDRRLSYWHRWTAFNSTTASEADTHPATSTFRHSLVFVSGLSTLGRGEYFLLHS